MFWERDKWEEKRYVVRLLPLRDSLSSSTPSPSSTVYIPIRYSDVAPTPSSPSIEVRPSLSLIDARGPSMIPKTTPSPSPIDAHGASSIPTSTPSPSLVVANMPTDEDVPNLAMEDPFPLNDRHMVTLINGVFHPSKIAANVITLSIRQQFGHPWPTWEQFQKIIRNFFSSVLRENWSGDLRKRMKLRKLLTRKPLVDFLRCLRILEIKIKAHIRLEIMSRTTCNHIGMHLGIVSSVRMPKTNWASEKCGCMHTEKLGRSAYVDKVFQQTHLRKDIGQFEEFEARLSQAKSDVASSGLKNKDLGLGIRLLLLDQSVRDAFMVLEILLVLINVEMKTSYNIHKDLPVALKIQRLREELRQSKEEISVF
ncbi:hypothetical protein HKD37_05G012961 [Glycine soja]